MDKSENVLFIDPYHGGSHQQLTELLIHYAEKPTVVVLKPKKWHWKARCSGLIISNLIPKITNQKVLFCTSVLNLAELLGLRPDLNQLKKIVYFHENQLVYPIQRIKERDVQYPINQITTCLAADVVVFNSNFNKDTFLKNINKIIKLIPEFTSKGIIERIQPKCMVLYFPVFYPVNEYRDRNQVLHIIWPHRWEHDKNPKEFFDTLFKLKTDGYKFQVSVLGEQYSEIPNSFIKAKTILIDEILQFGYMENKTDYLNVLQTGHVVVSTAEHEFFGVAMLEATFLGCYPLVPNRLVYPEIYPTECLYRDEEDLLLKLCEFCEYPTKAIEARKTLNIDLHKFSEEIIIPKFLELFQKK